MKFYLCQTKDGPRLAGTQLEAKKLDPKATIVDWATDKDSLMERFNDMFAQINGLNTPEAAHIDVIDEDDSAHIPVSAPPSKKAKVVEPDWQSAPEPGDCKRCIAMSKAARSIEGIMAFTNIEHAIQCGDKPFLRRIDEALEARAAELVG